MAGTQEENLKDMRQKGRDYTHEAVLASPEKLDMIKADLASTMPQYEIAEKYGISQSYLSTLKHTKLKEQNNGNT
jgi:ribosomal protein S25